MMCRGLPHSAVGLHTRQREGSLHHEGPWGCSRSRVWREALSNFNAVFAEEISPFLKVFSGWYPSKKIPNHLFSGIHGCRGSVYLLREGYTWCIDATFSPDMDDHPWPCAVHRSVRETVARVRRVRAMLGGRSRGRKKQPLPPRQASRHGSARRDDRNLDQNWRAVVSGAPDRRGQ
jgi:hypothetical protein